MATRHSPAHDGSEVKADDDAVPPAKAPPRHVPRALIQANKATWHPTATRHSQKEDHPQAERPSQPRRTRISETNVKIVPGET